MPEVCSNGSDDDCDGRMDCRDPDCSSDPACRVCTAELCGNGVDDDCDGRTDCADPDCADAAVCCVPTAEQCRDGADNDCDGRVDCSDSDCTGNPICMVCLPREVFCGNGVDDDCNGRMDCDDFACVFDPACTGACVPETGGLRCRNATDDDCDGQVDCADPDCASDPVCGFCAPREICNVPIDEDCDGLTDCADPDCAGDPACAPVCLPTEASCVNVADDDCNGLTDCADPACAGDPACFFMDAGLPDAGSDAGTDGSVCSAREKAVAMCTDGRDNDCDGPVDCADPDCSPFGPSGECCDGIDNDGDGQTDLFTCRCDTNVDCLGVGSLEQVCWTRTFSVCAPRCDFLGGQSFCDMVQPGLRCVTSGRLAGQCVPAGGPLPPPAPAA